MSRHSTMDIESGGSRVIYAILFLILLVHRNHVYENN